MSLMFDETVRIETSGRTGFVGDVVAVVTSITATAGLAISLAVLIFSGELSAGLPRAVAGFAAAGGVVAIWLALRSQLVPVATIIQDGPGMVMAGLTAGFATDEQTQVADVFVLLGFTTALTGVLLWLLGRCQLGKLVRCMPATVVAGFLAGAGWLLFKGGFEVMVDASVGLSDLQRLFTPAVGRLWLPGFVLGLLAWLVSRDRRFPPYAIGLMVLSSIGVFFGVALSVSSIGAIEDAGWLIGPFPESSEVALLSSEEVSNANWSAMVDSLPGIVGIAGLSAVSLLLNVSGIAAQLGQRIDVDDELRAAGIANLIAAPLCATPAFHSVGGTELLSQLGTKRRAVPLTAGLALVLLGVFGVGLIGYLPRIVPGAILVFLGLSLLAQWGRGLLESANWVERSLSVGILLATAWFGILPGIGLGLLGACAIFVVRYSHIDPIRHQRSGGEIQSRIDRTPDERAMMRLHADRVATFQLQGYLFFGSALLLERKLRAALRPPHQPPLGHDVVILDFGLVTGIETSASRVIGELVQELEDAQLKVILSSLPDRMRMEMVAHVPQVQGYAPCSLEEAVVYCEQRVIGQGRFPTTAPTTRCTATLVSATS